MTGSYFRGDAEAVLAPEDEAKFDTVTYTYYEQLNGYEHLKTLDQQARKAGVTLLPGTGFDVVPSDCLAASLAE